MTTLTDRPNTALLVIDMQEKVVADAYNRDTVIANIAALVSRARDEEVPVVWIQHSDDELPRESDGWQYISELERAETEPLVHKSYGDAFEDSELESVLAERGVGRIIVTGAQTDMCIRGTLHGALVRGYDATLVEDAHTTEDLRPWGVPVSPEQVIAHTNTYWTWAKVPGRSGDVVPTAQVDFAARP
jgi:nicotinamidase-related amidase